MSYPYKTVCIVCSIEKKTKFPKGIYCSNKCQQAHALANKQEKWLNNDPEASNYGSPILKKFVTIKDGYSCSVCSLNEWLNKPIVLELEHKNGNGTDNRVENLCLICPNCHSQTSTFKGRNKGNGRQTRYKQKTPS